MSLCCFHYFWKGLLERKLHNFALDSYLKITTQSIMISRIGWICIVWLISGLQSNSLVNPTTLFPIGEKIRGKARAHQLRQHFPEILSSHHAQIDLGLPRKGSWHFLFLRLKIQTLILSCWTYILRKHTTENSHVLLLRDRRRSSYICTVVACTVVKIRLQNSNSSAPENKESWHIWQN